MQNKALIDRFLRYVKIDTQSKDGTTVQPSTQKQFDLARVLVSELQQMGAQVDFDEEHCYIYAALPGTGEPLGFVSHMDTSPEASDTNVKSRIFTYDGHDDLLSADDFPELKNHIGEELIATDGTTLLGADDKAGVAEIMNLIEYYTSRPEKKHRPIKIAFTPDEETGNGTLNFDEERFGAKEAYTVDGGKWGIIEYECFNAAYAKVTFHGKSVHTGSAKNIMVNSMLLAVEFQNLMPAAETPEHTEGYEGFYHLDSMQGGVEETTLQYIIRDHDRQKFESRKKFVQHAVDYMKQKYGDDRVDLEMGDQYYNMLEIMKDHMNLVDNVTDIIRNMGTEPKSDAIRGGTDGADLCFRGIPCPNLSTGGYNYHGRYEYASIPEMEKTAELLIRLVALD